MSEPWWRAGVLYQIYPRSWVDSNADGIGDLPGIISHLDHLAWLGVDAIWLTPVTPSPNQDWGYDVSDYCAVHRDLGTLEDVEQLVAEAGARGIRVLMDLVPNHTSDHHPWFLDARSSRDSAYRDWYVWADPRSDGSFPNNWRSAFGGAAWTFDDPTGQWYLHHFLTEQPDLNWWNDEVRDAFDDILRFWFDRGIAGFRIDVCHVIVKDRELRDNPPAGPGDPPYARLIGQRPVHNSNLPEVHDVLRRWRSIADAYDPPRVLLGETFVMDLEQLAAYYGSGDELQLAFNFVFFFTGFQAEALRGVVEQWESLLPGKAWPAWTGSNHDFSRFPTRWCGGDDARMRIALMLLLTLRGTPVLYYGDEIGMVDVPSASAAARDPVGRDPGRTPMQWSPGAGAGFTAPGAQPWLPIGDNGSRNVEDQRADPGSILNLCRDLIALRRQTRDLVRGDYESLKGPDGTWLYRRGGVIVALNFSATEQQVDVPEGRVSISTGRNREGQPVSGKVSLRPWEGIVIAS